MAGLLTALALLAAGPPARAGVISTVAGNGSAGYAGDSGPATQAKLNLPRGITWTADGGFLVVEAANNTVRAIAPDGTIRTAAGTGAAGYSGDGGPATAATLNLPHGVAPMPDGGFVIADDLNNRIRRVWPDGTITTAAGTGAAAYSGDGGPATSAAIRAPRGVATTPDGSILIPDSDNARIRRVSPTGIITTVAGNGVAGYAGDGGAATAARLNKPFSVSPTADGGFLIADTANSVIRKVGADGVISTVAGTGVAGYSGDLGAATAARLDNPHSVAAKPDGGFLIAEPANQRVREVSSTGTIRTVAGSGPVGLTQGAFAGDGGEPTAARLNQPKGVALNAAGNFLIVDSENERVRLVDPSAAPPSDTTAPAPPTGLTASAGDGSVSLDWADNSEGDLDGYDVYRSTTPGGPYTTKLNSARLTGSAYTDTTAVNGTTYYYVVRAADRSGNVSDPSNEASATPKTSPYRAAVLGTSGLVSYWRLGETSGSTAADSKGSNNGTYFAGVALGQPGALAGDPDPAAGFDGNDDYVQVPDFGPPRDLTLEAWIYPKDTTTVGNRIIVDKNNNEYDLRLNQNGNIQLALGNPVQVAIDDSLNFETGAASGRWYHVAVVFDSAADSVRFYRNGTLTKTVTGITADIQNTTSPLRIGRHSPFDFGTFNGRIDEVALYDSALSGASIQAHYQAGTG